MRSDTHLMDFIVMPTALVFLAFFLGNIKIMIIPLLSIISTISLSGVIMYPVGYYFWDINNFAPSVMITLIIAMSIDYSLFLISRCVEEVVLLGREKEVAIDIMLSSSGHTIIVSGVTLCACFLGMILLPQTIFQSVGISASAGILSAIIVNLTLTPAILHTHLGDTLINSNFCIGATGQNSKGSLSSDGTEELTPTSVECEYWYGIENDLNSLDSSECDGSKSLEYPLVSVSEVTTIVNQDNQAVIEIGLPANGVEYINTNDVERSFWYRLGSFLLNPKRGLGVLVIILCAAVLVASYFPETSNSIAFELLLPTSSTSMLTFAELSRKFGYGYMSPFKIVFDGTRSNQTVESADAFDAINMVINSLVDLPATPDLNSFSGITMLNGNKIPFAVYTDAIRHCGGDNETARYGNDNHRRCNDELFRSIAYMAENEFNAPSKLATSTVVFLKVDPFSRDGIEWLTEARKRINQINNNNDNIAFPFEVLLIEGSSVTYDTAQSVYNCFPTMIISTTLAVFVFVGIFFRSIIVPLRSIVTVGLTEMVVFGLGVLVYQHGILEWTGLRCFTPAVSEITWAAPVLSFSLIIGLGLDYDIFLTSRILEHKEKEGLSNEMSVKIGLYKTGSIITAAGIVMFIAFGGLLFSQTMALNQWAFLMSVAVLFDTFVIRTLLVPIFMGLTGDYSWFPRRMPMTK